MIVLLLGTPRKRILDQVTNPTLTEQVVELEKKLEKALKETEEKANLSTLPLTCRESLREIWSVSPSLLGGEYSMDLF